MYRWHCSLTFMLFILFYLLFYYSYSYSSYRKPAQNSAVLSSNGILPALKGPFRAFSLRGDPWFACVLCTGTQSSYQCADKRQERRINMQISHFADAFNTFGRSQGHNTVNLWEMLFWCLQNCVVKKTPQVIFSLKFTLSEHFTVHVCPTCRLIFVIYYWWSSSYALVQWRTVVEALRVCLLTTGCLCVWTTFFS